MQKRLFAWVLQYHTYCGIIITYALVMLNAKQHLAL